VRRGGEGVHTAERLGQAGANNLPLGLLTRQVSDDFVLDVVTVAIASYVLGMIYAAFAGGYRGY